MIAIISSCIDQPKFDPCKGLTPTSAAFSVRGALLSYYGIDTSQMRADTFYVEGANLLFSVNDKSVDSCAWQIGQDPKIWREKAFTLYFDKPYGLIGVKLTAKKKPVSSCFSEDNGEETLSKTIAILPWFEHPIFGRHYVGTDDEHPDEPYEMFIYYKSKVQQFVYIYNFPNGSNQDSMMTFPQSRIGLYSIRYFQSDALFDKRDKETGAIYDVHGYLSKNFDTLTIKYTRDEIYNLKRVPYKHLFKGIIKNT